MEIIRLNRHQILAVARLTRDVVNNFTMYQAESLEIIDGDNSDKFYDPVIMISKWGVEKWGAIPHKWYFSIRWNQ